MKSAALAIVFAFIAFLGVSMLLRGGGGVAPTPEVLDNTFTLASAVEASEESGKPVFVLVTADWCPPCQMLKRETLTDSRVSSYIDERTHAVYLLDETDRPQINELGVTAYPTALVLEGGREVGRSTGFTRPDSFLKFLEMSVDMAGETATPAAAQPG